MHNQAVKRSLIKASGGSPEADLAIGRIWLELAGARTAIDVWMVEGAANIADGPSRGKYDELAALDATFVDPVVIAWFDDVWCGIEQP